jgi:hypothetical protein
MHGPKIAVCWSEDAQSGGNEKQARIVKKNQGFVMVPKNVYDTCVCEDEVWLEDIYEILERTGHGER